MSSWLQGAHGVKVISLADLSSGMLNNTEEAHAAGQAAEHQQAAARAESFVTADEARDTVAPLDTPPQTGQHPIREGRQAAWQSGSWIVRWLIRHEALWHLQHMPAQTGQLLLLGCEEGHIIVTFGFGTAWPAGSVGGKMVSFRWTCVVKHVTKGCCGEADATSDQRLCTRDTGRLRHLMRQTRQASWRWRCRSVQRGVVMGMAGAPACFFEGSAHNLVCLLCTCGGQPDAIMCERGLGRCGTQLPLERLRPASLRDRISTKGLIACRAAAEGLE